tara:strand:- start:1465 stop:3099 length:1635 start_codon:yes stop_codon:yes gene_type:complete
MNDWWKKAVIYQIYPRSYLDTSDNGIGDLNGVIQKIDYLSDLGIEAIWLSPFFTSPMQDMGYDVSNYTSIDPLFGTIKDFDELISIAHKNNIKIIIDQVLSHSSDQHEAFIDSKSSKNSNRSDWYVWADPKEDGSPPNNWLSVFGGSAWEWEPQRGQYYFHNFLPSQPDFNFHNEEVQNFLLSVVKFWLDKGVDGFRLDTVNYYFHDKKLRDNPKSPVTFSRPPVNPYYMQNQIFAINQDENLIFLNKLRELLDVYPEKTLVGEIGDSHRAVEIMKSYTRNSRLHMAYSFELLGKEFSSVFIRSTLEQFFQEGEESWPCWSFSNHDVTRHVTRWCKDETESFAKLTCALLLSLKGTPCIYQGEELGQTETELLYEEITDPPGIRFWPKNKGRDGCRTPMTWNHKLNNAGFSDVIPWLPVKDKQKSKSVSIQEKEPNSVLNFYKKFIAYRKLDSALTEGNQMFLSDKNNILVFLRECKDSKTLCIFNLGPLQHAIKRFFNYDDNEVISSEVKLTKNEIEINKYGFMIISNIQIETKYLKDIFNIN